MALEPKQPPLAGLPPLDGDAEVDLGPEDRRDILQALGAAAAGDHWRVLELPWGASAEQARAAYLERAKRFHPDRYAGRRLGGWLPRLERIFRALTLARDELTDEARRAAYARRTAPADEWARQEARKLADEARAQERRARLARANPLVARAERVRQLMERGSRALEEGRAAQALNDFATVIGLEPRHAEAHALADRARRRAGVERAREAWQRALEAEATGASAAALEAAQDAVHADPGNPRYGAGLSRLALAAGKLTLAREAAQSAVRAAPSDARAHAALGAALHAAGEVREARRALETALELDPSLDAAKALLKKTRWSFLG